MNSHICVILLCLSGVLCVSTTIGNLDLNGLKRILNGQTKVNEWEAAMDQNVFYVEADGSKSTVNVREAVHGFKRTAGNGSAADFEKIRTIIKTAYQCTLTKYAGLTTWLTFQDLFQLKTSVDEAIRYTKDNSSDFDAQTVFENQTFQDAFEYLNHGKIYLDLDLKFHGHFQLFGHHVFNVPAKKGIHLLWEDIVKKMLGLKIMYKIYPDVMRTKFTNEYDQPLVDYLNELICVLNEAVRLFDNFIVDNCVRHGGSFQKNFQSLKKGLNRNFHSVLKQFDKMKGTDTNLLVSDFTKSIPGTSSEIAAIEASGCFVVDSEFEISGLRTDWLNAKNSAEIYGHNFIARISEINTKLVETVEKQPQNDIQIGMMMFRDESHSTDFGPELRNPPNENNVIYIHFV